MQYLNLNQIKSKLINDEKQNYSNLQSGCHKPVSCFFPSPSFATRGWLFRICNAVIPEMIDQRVNYIHENPVRALIVSHAHEYLFSSAVDYAGGKGYVNVQVEM